ncbi:MAG TPA: hypothetical protein VFB25_14195 [Gaiellaceae bacterium]|nr:hypothetical protein [Gaiellaceae bacterium]
MHGQEIIGADDHKLGTVVAERDGFAIVELGHVFKSKHAIPQEFLHEYDGQLRATVAKELVSDSPKVDDDDFDPNAIKLHYGLVDVAVVDPDPTLDNAETEGRRHGIEPAPSERLGTLGGAGDSTIEAPASFDRPTNSGDPSWSRDDRK